MREIEVEEHFQKEQVLNSFSGNATYMKYIWVYETWSQGLERHPTWDKLFTWRRSVFYCPHLRYRWPLTLNFTYCLCICKAGRQLGLEDLFLGTLHQLVAAVTPPHVDLTGLRHQGRLPCLYAVWADTGAGVVWCHSTYLREHFKDCMNTKTSGRVLDSKHCSNYISSVWIHLQ